ncbi:hypothetical protein U1Q18_048513, partial [Sarracenia purpurea var. burkii]
YSYTAFQDPDLLMKWQQRIPRKDRVIKPGDRVCEKHFSSDQIIKAFEVSSLPNGETFRIPREKARLKDGAVPSIFPNCPKYLSSVPKKPRKSPKKRQKPPLPVKKTPLKSSEPELVVPAVQFLDVS